MEEQLSRNSLGLWKVACHPYTRTVQISHVPATARTFRAGWCKNDFSISLLSFHRYRRAGGDRPGLRRGSIVAHPELAGPRRLPRAPLPAGMKESPQRARSELPGPSQPPQSHDGAQAGKARSSHSRTALAKPEPRAGSLTEPRPHSPHGSPLHVRHFKPCPPARATSDSLHHRFFFFSRGEGLSPVSLPHTNGSALISSFYCCCYRLGVFLHFSTHIVQKFPRLHRTLPGHTGDVLTATFQPQGELLI